MQPEPKVNILLVDDKVENLLALEAILERLGANLVRATSGEEALRCLLHQDFAVILLDVQMPGMDGFETATLIRNRGRSRQTPIIFLTAFSTSDQMLFKGYALGAVDYLLKPIDANILTSKVTVFVELFKKTQAIQRQAAQLAAINAELRQSEERFRSLSTCSPIGIFETDTAGCCKYTNPRYQAICGLDATESLDKRWLESVHPEDQERAIASWSTYIDQGGDYSDEFRFQTVDGSLRWVQVRSSPMLSGNGELLGHVGTLEDITARKQSEEIRAQVIREQTARQEAEAANRMKDEFLAVLSHELRTPLTSMLGWSKILRAKKLDEKATARALEAIERNANSQVQLIEDILDVSRIIRGQLRLNLSPVNLTTVVEAALEAVRPLADTKSMTINTALDYTLSPVSGDSARLQQIVWNLLTNAIKFTPKEGKVEIRLEGISGGLSDDLTHAQIQVIDTGIGIEREFLPKVFERFRQADSTTTRSHNGLGLGLAIVRHLVELHKGTILAESPGVGKGATFTVRFPLIQENREPRPAPTENFSGDGANSSPLAGLKVLIVDDETDTRNFLGFLFEEYGAISSTSASVETALAVIDQLKPDILISDIGMAEQDGYTLIRKLRSLPPEQGGEIPAIALTAYSREEDRQQIIEAGFQYHLCKPIDPNQLISVVASIFRLSPALSKLG
ncbi:PAS/PAC sensor hybrid histidine kinase [Trichormus variabilis ATCC 29413]|uniref:Circadian input-output histidine kinase CikA n=2 Tax=Anabaena variabilis TaxID=264691 RepID=Q3M3Q6_TRIV2|nr:MULTISPECIES: response regulator [Nostocaceae]ABA24380.1 PAS/PAC sensor hybrid histidine kinase [Trichormus variabilis ATCC 29413]MBC1216160.1 response regulator [Trichormus variabilis ARAD]MBC1254195.1 response regulator [Trichormus variabilis V5]MBC1266600.1 response regulator [Trichormus variabilis FSR]MBC1301596.1 response regulator [Trichormus variabilis N2B]